MHIRKLEVLWREGTSMKGDVSAARFSSGLRALLTLCHLLCFPVQLPSGLQAETSHLIVALLSRAGLAKDHHKSIQESCLDLRWIKRYRLRLMMGSSFKANKSEKLINIKLIPPCEVDAYFFNIMFHSLGTEGPHNFQFLLSPCPSQKWFFLVVKSSGSIKRISITAAGNSGWSLILKFPFPLFYREKPWRISGSQLGINAEGSIEMRNGDNL